MSCWNNSNFRENLLYFFLMRYFSLYHRPSSGCSLIVERRALIIFISSTSTCVQSVCSCRSAESKSNYDLLASTIFGPHGFPIAHSITRLLSSFSFAAQSDPLNILLEKWLSSCDLVALLRIIYWPDTALLNSLQFVFAYDSISKSYGQLYFMISFRSLFV